MTGSYLHHSMDVVLRQAAPRIKNQGSADEGETWFLYLEIDALTEQASLRVVRERQRTRPTQPRDDRAWRVRGGCSRRG